MNINFQAVWPLPHVTVENYGRWHKHKCLDYGLRSKRVEMDFNRRDPYSIYKQITIIDVDIQFPRYLQNEVCYSLPKIASGI